jgi:uncharacterized protein (DUF1810 family)
MPDIAETGDSYNLQRFVEAQSRVYDEVRKELSRGRKQSHWMWFVFPQVRGLGFSRMSEVYAIGSLAEALAYLAHPILGPRLEETTRLMLAQRGRPLIEVLGSPDDLKFQSSMTLFSAAAGPGSIFAEALDALCGGEKDARTLALLAGE